MIRWLYLGCALIFVMVVIGGITRLTHSGLSMVDWKPVTGAIPPLSETQWQNEFEKYQQFPEFQKINYDFTLEEFKSIFWWEYLHRLLGRLIGVVFLIPFLVFLANRKIPEGYTPRLLLIFLLGGLQGLLGWYMVKSGLVDVPSVSHYRLAAHLVTAFLTFAVTFDTALKLQFSGYEEGHASLKKYRKEMIWFVVFLSVQIIYGAFVAGLKAGLVFNTFPKMGDSWIAEAVTAMSPFWKNFVSGLAGVQFIHRYLATGLLVWGLVYWFRSKNEPLGKYQARAFNYFGVTLGIQFLLGVITLLMKVPVFMGVAHQAGAFLLLGTCLFVLNRTSNKVKKVTPTLVEV
ncbi:heme A synthase [Fulvitalea axinellae]|uniref:Heme A synthase n=2 Tax=Fulvitalea axinellae TaxID=1182444 RepID=A0AAU9DC23_9BACT|nr:heme A synthase [Fulvitalea axinellae]